MTGNEQPPDRGFPDRGFPDRGLPRRGAVPLGAQPPGGQLPSAQLPSGHPTGDQQPRTPQPRTQFSAGQFSAAQFAGLQFPNVTPTLGATSTQPTSAQPTSAQPTSDRQTGDRLLSGERPSGRRAGATSAGRGSRRISPAAAIAPVALLVLIAPVLLLFVRLWHTTTVASDTTLAERAAVAYARPVDKLLAALLDAQYAAARRSTVDVAGVRSAAAEVDAADRATSNGATSNSATGNSASNDSADDPLQVRSRWTQLRHEVDTVLDKHVAGPDALTAYASPIALTQALLGQLAESAGASGAPSPGANQLTRVALRDLPDALVGAGTVAALAASGPNGTAGPNATAGSAPQLAVVGDRMTRAAADVSSGLRAGTDPGANYAVDLTLLSPLDSFSAAADAFTQTVAGLDAQASGARDRVDAANTQLRTKALALQAAVLDTLDKQLAADAHGQAGQRRELLFAAVAILAAAAVLLWAGVRRRTAPRTDRYPDAEVRSRAPDLLDARELIGSGLAPGGLAPGGLAAGPR